LGSQVNLSTNSFVPALQREDGSYIGTDGNNNLIALGLDGNVIWQQNIPFGLTGGITPLYATADGGTIVTTSQPACAPGDIAYTYFSPYVACQIQSNLTPLQAGYGQLGTLCTLDKDGNVTSQTPDPGAAYSWTNQWYDPPAGGTTVSAVTLPPLYLASSFMAVLAGNLSLNGATIKEQWFPPLETGKHDSVCNALDDLISRLNDPAISALAQTNIFNKLKNDSNGVALTTASFLRYLTTKHPLFYNGL